MEDISSQLIAPSLGPSHTPPGRRSIRLAPSFDAYTKETGALQPKDGGKEEGEKKGKSLGDGGDTGKSLAIVSSVLFKGNISVCIQ